MYNMLMMVKCVSNSVVFGSKSREIEGNREIYRRIVCTYVCVCECMFGGGSKMRSSHIVRCLFDFRIQLLKIEI